MFKMATNQEISCKLEVFEYLVDFMKELGRGAFGTVYRGINSDTSEAVAVKKVSKKAKQQVSFEAIRALYFKDEIRHNNIVIVRDIKTWQDSMWIMMEFCDLGDLNDFFQNHESTIKSIEAKAILMRQILSGIVFLHNKNIVHRDIKPGNILLKSTTNNTVVVKLGDFGLSKALDPDAQTSAMSSDVGTFVFRAPEFWAKKQNDRLLYHRNIDVYAAGLTFAAMLQFRSGSLVPKPEGDLLSSEKNMPIGLAAQYRMINKQEDIVVMEIKEGDSMTTRKLKSLIQGMTHVSAEERMSAAAVESRLHAMVDASETTRCFSLKLNFLVEMMCFLNNYLVVRGKEHNSDRRLFWAFDIETGNCSKEWATECQHFIECGSLVASRILHNDHTQDLVEGCLLCSVIRIYDVTTGNTTTVHESIQPYKLCNGPAETILVWDTTTKKVHQVRNINNRWDVVPTRVGPFTFQLLAMCYLQHSDTIVLLTFIGNLTTLKINGIKMESGQIIWRNSRSLCDPPRDPEDICSTVKGLIYVSHGNRLFSVDPTDGSTGAALLEDENLEYISEVVCSQDTSCKVAIKHGEFHRKITCYNVNYATQELPLNFDSDSTLDL